MILTPVIVTLPVTAAHCEEERSFDVKLRRSLQRGSGSPQGREECGLQSSPRLGWSPGNKNNKEINTALIDSTSGRRHKHQAGPVRKYFLIYMKRVPPTIMTQMVVDIFRAKYLHPLAVKND